jgi:tetratricopeptide (TPR) repeat protein
MKNLSGSSLLLLAVALPAAWCPAQEAPVTQPAQPPAVRSPADMSIPELFAVGQQYRAARRYNEAVNVFRLILERDPTNIDALRVLGDIFWETKNAELAKNSWLRVRELQPNDFIANFGLGRLYLEQGVYRQAMSYLETAESVVPAYPPELEGQVLVGLAQAYRGAGRREQAIETIKRALERAPNSFEAQYVLVMLQTEVAIREKTGEDFDRALVEAQKLVQIAGSDLQAGGTTPERVQTLQLAYQAELQVLYAFREMLFERNPDGRLSDRLLPNMEKRLAAIITRIVDVMLRQADLERTMAHFKILELAAAAVKYDGGTNPSTLLDLGLLQKQTAQWQSAVETFQKVLELDPGNEVARRELDALQMRLPAPASTQPVGVTP